MSTQEYKNNLKVRCVGRGSENDGCGYKGGISGGVCPICGGMLLSEKVIEEAKELVKKVV
jgi:hypothetical protein